jgi:hypothetical protein
MKAASIFGSIDAAFSLSDARPVAHHVAVVATTASMTGSKSMPRGSHIDRSRLRAFAISVR